MNEFLFVIWFFIPAGFANMAPLLANKIPYINTFTYPLDGHKSFRGKRILGNNKTFRGLLSGIIIGVIVAVIQQWVAYDLVKLSFIPHSFLLINPVLFGALSGFGALIGDSLKSFAKRQIGIASGTSWFPFDQVDYIIGGVFCTLLVYRLSLKEYIILFITFFCLHLLISFIGYRFHFKSAPI